MYGRIWGLARTATLLAVDQDDDEITHILQNYIRRKSNQNEPERPPVDERIAIDESLPIEERSIINITGEIFNNSQEIQINHSDTSSNLNRSHQIEGETEIEREVIDINLQTVENPNRVITKGRPPKRRYLSSIEKAQGVRGRPKTRGSYRCRVCNGVGHNAAFHKNK